MEETGDEQEVLLAVGGCSAWRSVSSRRVAMSVRPGVLEDLATNQGRPRYRQRVDSTWSYEFVDEETVRRALVAPADLAALVGPGRGDEARTRSPAGSRATVPLTAATACRTASTP